MRLPELSFSFLHGAQTIQKTQKKHLLNARCFFVLLNVVPGGFERIAYLSEFSMFLVPRFDLWNTNWNTSDVNAVQ